MEFKLFKKNPIIVKTFSLSNFPFYLAKKKHELHGPFTQKKIKNLKVSEQLQK